MLERNRTRAALLACAGLVVLLASGGCGSAEAKPVEVTYYYLPG